MSIKFECSECFHRMKVDEKHAGRAMKCPGCGHALKVPRQAGSQQSAGSRKKTRQTSPPADEDDYGFDDFEEDIEASKPKKKRPIDDGPALPSRRRGSGAKKKKPKGASGKEGSRRKKKREEEESLGWLPVVIICGGVAFMLLIGTLGFFFGGDIVTKLAGGGEVVAPSEFELAENKDSQTKVLLPKGWEYTASGGTGGKPVTIRTNNDGVKIQIRANPKGDMMGSIANAGAAVGAPGAGLGAMGNDVGDVEDIAPIAQVHSFVRDFVTQDFSNYTEQPGQPIDSGMGEGRVSSFTASGTFGSTIYGYRVSLWSSKYQLNVIMQMTSQKKHEAYWPVLKKIVGSLE